MPRFTPWWLFIFGHFASNLVKFARDALRSGPRLGVQVSIRGTAQQSIDGPWRDERAAPAAVVSPAVFGDDSNTWTNSLGMKFVWLAAEKFWIGGGGGKKGDHLVEISRGFYLGVHPVTQGQWVKLMGANPSWFCRSGKGSDKVSFNSDEELKEFPVDYVSWQDAQEFISKLNSQEKNSDWSYRLPSEIEWEYACRCGGTTEKECSFDFYLERRSNALSSKFANFDGNFPVGKAAKGPYIQRTTKVGSYEPNRLGIFDMHGNVWEWCVRRQISFPISDN